LILPVIPAIQNTNPAQNSALSTSSKWSLIIPITRVTSKRTSR
uniref:Uncharacterized protein n=1 Tax=Haemonchus placei TaxID=6290 RepID=A0A0N4W317_HAEPC